MLEVDVDVGRLVALARDEALEQHVHARRIDLGDAERIADRRVGRGAAALAQDAAPARKLDEVVHGQEIALVAEFRDQREFALEQFPHRPAARRPASAAPRPARPAAAGAQRGVLAGRHDLLRVFVAEFVEREAAASGDLERRIEQCPRIQLREPRERAQRRARRSDAARCPACATVVFRRIAVSVSCSARRRRWCMCTSPLRDGRYPELRAPAPRAAASRSRSAPAAGSSTASHKPPGEALAQPGALVRPRHRSRQPQHEAVLEPVCEIRPSERVASLRRRAARARDQPRERAVALPAGREADQPQTVRERELAADDQREAAVARRGMGAHDAGQRAFVGQRECGVAELPRAPDEFVRMRGTAQEREVAEAVQLGVRHRRVIHGARAGSRPGLRSFAPPELTRSLAGSRPPRAARPRSVPRCARARWRGSRERTRKFRRSSRARNPAGSRAVRAGHDAWRSSPNTPCRNQSWPGGRSRKIHSRTPSRVSAT